MTMKSISNFKRRDFLTCMGFASALPIMLPLEAFATQTNTVVAGRRVVTGLNSSGKSIILSDGLVPENARGSDLKEGTSFSDLWIEQQVPVDLKDNVDHLIGYSPTTEPPPGGVTARIITWREGFSYPSHSTETLDFIFVISGKLELILDEGSTIVAPGDSVVQRGTNHGWRVVGDSPCIVVAVLLSALKKQ